MTKYEGFEDRHYVCLHSSSFNLYHQGKGGIEMAFRRNASPSSVSFGTIDVVHS